MPTVLGEGIFSAYRQNAIAHLVAIGQKPSPQKKVTIEQQMHEHLQSFMPGYAGCLADVFDSETALWAARTFDSAATIVAA